MTIEIEEKTAHLLSKLRVQATARNMSLEEYLEQFVEPVRRDANSADSLEELDRVLGELTSLPLNASSLPIDFSRADIYADHN